MALPRYVFSLLIAIACLPPGAAANDPDKVLVKGKPLARNEGDPDGAAWAVKWLALLEKGVTRDRLLAAMHDEPLAPPSSRQSYCDSR